MDQPIDLESILASPQIPTLPAVAAQVLALSRDENVRLSDLAQIIQNDQALATKVLRTVNSAYYGLTKPCSTIRNAITYLGLNAVRVLALSFTLVETINGGRDETDISFDYLRYWRRAVYSAVCARRLARITGGIDPEEAFLAALLQDIGMIVLYRALGEKYLQAIDLAEADHRDLLAIEQRAFALSHDVVGERLAERWNLPREQITAIRYSHHPALAPFDDRALAHLVYASTLVAMMVSGSGDEPLMAEILEILRERYSLDHDLADAILNDVAKDAAELSRVLDLDTGERVDVKRLLEEAEEALTFAQCELASSAGAERPRALDRSAFNRTVEKLFRAARETGEPFSVLFVGLDGIDDLNEREGHSTGDHAISYLERFLADATPEDAMTARYVAAQFALLLPGADSAAALRTAQQLQRRLASIETFPDEVTPVKEAIGRLSISVGVASYQRGESACNTWSALVRGAAGALHAAKKRGPGEIRWYANARPPGSSAAA